MPRMQCLRWCAPSTRSTPVRGNTSNRSAASPTLAASTTTSPFLHPRLRASPASNSSPSASTTATTTWAYPRLSSAPLRVRQSRRMRFELFVAARYLRAKRRQAVVGVVTGISVAGVAAGVASLILALAITNGMRRDLQDRLLGSTAHVELMRVASDGIRKWRELTERLRHAPHVTAAAPGLYGQVLVSRGAHSGGALVKGVIPAEEKTVSDLLQSVK